MNWVDFIVIWFFYVCILIIDNYLDGELKIEYDILVILWFFWLLWFFKVNLGF